MSIKAKFKVTTVKHVDWSDAVRVIELSAVTSGSKENADWSKWTPAGSISLTIDNPVASDQLKLGSEVYVELTPAN